MKFIEVANHYMGVEMFSEDNQAVWRLTPTSYYAEMSNRNPFTESKPILRKLEDMTEEDMKSLVRLKNNITNGFEYISANEYSVQWREKGYEYSIDTWFCELRATQFHFLCQQGYDLFGLIESGEALDAKTVKK